MIGIEESYARCTALARSHYENFPVGLLVPKKLQHHVHAVYAFARISDDFADEGYTNDPDKPTTSGLEQPRTEEERLKALNDWEDQLLHPERKDRHPIFPAVEDTIKALSLPQSLFTDLLSAFKQDVVKRRYNDFNEVLDYCRRSANPVGRLVLLLHGIKDEVLHKQSDAICTALQLANFWQDVSVDLKKDRIYLPQEDLNRYGVPIESLFAHESSQSYKDLLRYQVDRTWGIFDNGKSLASALPFPLSLEIRFTWLGGTTILKKIQQLDYDTLHARPKLHKSDFVTLGCRALLPL